MTAYRGMFAKELPVDNNGRMITALLAGVAIGAGIALLFAPQSGRETREWIAERSEDELKGLRRKGRRSLDHFQDMVEQGEEKLTRAMRTGKDVLDSLASKLD
ncbi:MAG: YtxH domain-containing protein [Candidatus Acidiferrales bacterium]